jgi:hypothetical protein
VHPQLNASGIAWLLSRRPRSVGQKGHLLLLLEGYAVQIFVSRFRGAQCYMNTISLNTLSAILLRRTTNLQIQVMDDLNRLMRNTLSGVSLVNLVRIYLNLHTNGSPIFVLLETQIELINLGRIHVNRARCHVVIAVIAVP